MSKWSPISGTAHLRRDRRVVILFVALKCSENCEVAAITEFHQMYRGRGALMLANVAPATSCIIDLLLLVFQGTRAETCRPTAGALRRECD